MKTFLFIPFLFIFSMAIGQTYTSTSIIGNPKIISIEPIGIGKFEVAQNDFPTKMNWYEANNACIKLGLGWRLPNIDELDIICRTKNSVGGFAQFEYYWSSNEWSDNSVAIHSMGRDQHRSGGKNELYYVRAVRGNIVTAQIVSSATIIGKPIFISTNSSVVQNFEVAQFDFTYKANWADAIDSCLNLGDGLRLPTKDQLNYIFKNKNKIGGFAEAAYYWSSTEYDEDNAWEQDFTNGEQSITDKVYDGESGYSTYFRAVRSF